ncbi:MAG TPA: MFS transporter [Gemmataceae bacterium]|nr:MFS transporter [Gemmataceae bacterium]
MGTTRPRLLFTLLVLVGINTMNFFDRQVIGAVGEPIKHAFRLSDAQLGLLGSAFIYLYAVVGLPLGYWADVGRRKTILAAGAVLWSFLTSLSGFAWSAASLFAMRLGVGVGEASCAPAANSLIGDLFPPQRRAWALSVFMFGLPLGLGLSFVVSGEIAYRWTWRGALFAAGLPGLVLGLLVLWIPEPPRGGAELHRVGSARRQGSPLVAVMRIPTMWWIVLSGALHNFNMYALGHFLSPLLIREYGVRIDRANWICGLVYGFGGGLGVLVGGWLCDRAVRRRISGRLELAALALLISTPCLFLALQQSREHLWGFAGWMLPACVCLYVYYSGVYATIQDIVEPGLRGTAMALYFCAMYLLGAAQGPWATGMTSDYFARQAAAANPNGVPAVVALLAGSPLVGAPVYAPWAALAVNQQNRQLAIATGLHQAMYLTVVLSGALVLVLLAAAWTVPADYEKLQKWMKNQVSGSP